MRSKTAPGGGAAPVPVTPWFAGAAIGLTILGMASGAIALGAGMALAGSTAGR